MGPIWLGLGLGLGIAYSDSSQLIKSSHDSILDSALKRYDSENSIEEKKILEIPNK